MTRLVCASGVAGVALVVAALESGALESDGRSVLLVANEAEIPEIVVDPRDTPGFDALTRAFDEVVSWNELISPLHPTAWRPPAPEIPLLVRLLAARVAPADAVDELVVESVTAGAGRALADLVPDVPITLVCGSASAYAPPVVDASSEIGARVSRVLHLDLVPDLPARLRFHDDTTTVAVPTSAFRDAIALLPAEVPDVDAVLLGDRDAELGRLSVEDEFAHRLDTVRALVAGGRPRILFAPHPAAAPVDPTAFVEAAAGVGAHLEVGPAGVAHEVVSLQSRALVVGTAAPALYLADQAATSGVAALLALPPKRNWADRAALTVAAAVLPQLGSGGELTVPSTDLAELAATLGRGEQDPTTPARPRSRSRRLAARARRWVNEKR